MPTGNGWSWRGCPLCRLCQSKDDGAAGHGHSLTPPHGGGALWTFRFFSVFFRERSDSIDFGAFS